MKDNDHVRQIVIFPHEHLKKNTSFHECNLLSYLSNSTYAMSMVTKWRNWLAFTSILENNINFFVNSREVMNYLFGITCICGLRVFIIPG